MPNVLLSKAFLSEALGSGLPQAIRNRVLTLSEQLRQPHGTNGLNLEALPGAATARFRSARVNDNYRIILHQDAQGNFTLLHLGKHDEAYRWAARHRFEVNAVTGELQLYLVDVPAQPAPPPSSEVAPPPALPPQPAAPIALFAERPTDQELIRLGIPEAQLALVRSLRDEEDLLGHEGDFSQRAFEALMGLYDGRTPEEIIQEFELPDHSEHSADDVAAAFQASELSQDTFVFLSQDLALDEIRRSGLAQWRIFLHPSQRKIVTKRANGPIKVLGGAGTGKTVVAMHRVKHLLGILPAPSRILFTTYTRNLAEDIRRLLATLCTPEEMRRVEVVNLDAWAARYLNARSRSPFTLLQAEQAHELMEEARAEVPGAEVWSVDFLLRERANIVLPNAISSLQQYLRVSRMGRGTRLSAGQKQGVWQILDKYRQLLEAKRLRDYDEVMLLAAKQLERDPVGSPYASVVADEVQDFGACALRLLAVLSGNTREQARPDSLMVVGDAHQRIYGKCAILSRCGINVRGRSYKLYINYRTTDKIRRRAVALLDGVTVDDLDGSEDNNKRFHSLVPGVAPEERRFDTFEQEMDAIAETIRTWQAADNASGDARRLNDYAVLARSNTRCRAIVAALTARGLAARQLDSNDTPRDEAQPFVPVMTMHRAKGLEFAGIIVAELNPGTWPYRPDNLAEMDPIAQQQALNAERSLLYVALTRAIKHAMLIGIGAPPPELTPKNR